MNKTYSIIGLSNSLNEYITKLSEELNVSSGSLVVSNITKTLQNPLYKVTGSTIASMKTNKIGFGFKKQNLIVFNTPSVDLMERGKESKAYKYFKYPKFILFKENEGLRQWALSKSELGSSFVENNRGLRIGGDNTSFGEKKWFTNSMESVKSELSKTIKSSLSKIKLK